jgi:hypothetical protein
MLIIGLRWFCQKEWRHFKYLQFRNENRYGDICTGSVTVNMWTSFFQGQLKETKALLLMTSQKGLCQ